MRGGRFNQSTDVPAMERNRHPEAAVNDRRRHLKLLVIPDLPALPGGATCIIDSDSTSMYGGLPYNGLGGGGPEEEDLRGCLRCSMDVTPDCVGVTDVGPSPLGLS